MRRVISQKEFIEKCEIIHNYKFDYSKTKYINKKGKVLIICPLHGEFEQSARNHISGMGCQKCARKVVGILTRNNGNAFIEKCKNVHNNKFDYTKTLYVSGRNKIIIICPQHGEFTQIANTHLHGKAGCMQCYKDIHEWSTIKFIEKSKKVHNNYYDYSKSELISSRKKLIIICPLHGEFEQSPNHHMNGHGCRKCNTSIGENNIIKILNYNNINYKHEFSFENCKSLKNYPLRFDFYLPDYNLCIEFDGRQHYEVSNHFGEEGFITLQSNDLIKNKFCEINNINLLRIKYNTKNIEKMILDTLNNNL